MWSQVGAIPVNLQRATKETLWVIDPSPHTTRSVAVDERTKLEVLDWGGSGRPLVLLAGLGSTAHVFDAFAPKLTDRYHVFGITRRGFGNSSSPVPNGENYSSDRLADDVLAVTDAFKLEKPILAGHSLAGEELSSIATRHPDKTAGVIYLDAGFPYALYDPARGDLQLDALDTQQKLLRLTRGEYSNDQEQLIESLLSNLPQFEKDLQEQLGNLQTMPSFSRGFPQSSDPVARAASLVARLPHESCFPGYTPYGSADWGRQNRPR